MPSTESAHAWSPREFGIYGGGYLTLLYLASVFFGTSAVVLDADSPWAASTVLVRRSEAYSIGERACGPRA